MDWDSSPSGTRIRVVGRPDKGQPSWAGGLVDEYADVVKALRVLDQVGFFISLAVGSDGCRHLRGTGWKGRSHHGRTDRQEQRWAIRPAALIRSENSFAMGDTS